MDTRFLRTQIPVWVSRPTADDQIAVSSVSGWMWTLGWLLILLNFFIWSVIGLYEAGRVVF